MSRSLGSSVEWEKQKNSWTSNIPNKELEGISIIAARNWNSSKSFPSFDTGAPQFKFPRRCDIVSQRYFNATSHIREIKLNGWSFCFSYDLRWPAFHPTARSFRQRCSEKNTWLACQPIGEEFRFSLKHQAKLMPHWCSHEIHWNLFLLLLVAVTTQTDHFCTQATLVSRLVAIPPSGYLRHRSCFLIKKKNHSTVHYTYKQWFYSASSACVSAVTTQHYLSCNNFIP